MKTRSHQFTASQKALRDAKRQAIIEGWGRFSNPVLDPDFDRYPLYA